MAAEAGGAGVPSRSQIEAWDVEHLHAAAEHWTSTAQRWEEHYSAIHAGMLAPGGTTWEGDAAEAAQERSWADLVKVRGLANCLHDASAVARNGAEDITWAKRQTLDGIAEAEENRFAVAEDLSVIPPSASSPLARVPISEAVAAQEYTSEIATRAQTLASIDQQVASSITSALAPLKGASFGDSSGDRAPVMQAMGNKYKTDVQDGDHDPWTGADNNKPQPKTPLPPTFDPNTGAAENGGGPLGKILQHEIEPYEEGAAGAVVESGPLANASKAVIDPRKFAEYSMDPANPSNNGKWQAWQQIGFDVNSAADRSAATQNVIEQIRAQLPNAPATVGKLTNFGQRFEVDTIINGPSGQGTLKMVYQMEDGVPRLVTNWLEVHK